MKTCLMKGALFMQIKFHEESRLFQLDSKNSTYAFQINEGGYLVHLYYGKKLSSLQGLEKNAFRGVYDSLSPQNPYVDGSGISASPPFLCGGKRGIQ